jgi:cell wall-associated NlpC family hydrolase
VLLTPRIRRLAGVAAGVALLVAGLAAPAAGSPIDDKRAEARRLAARIDALGQRLSVLDEDYNEARLRLDELTAKVLEARRRAADTRERYETARERARARAVAAYVDGGMVRRAAMVAQGPGEELSLRREYLAVLAADDRAAIDELAAAREDLAARQADLDAQHAAAVAARDRLQAARRAVAQAMAEQKALLARAQGELDALVRAEEARRAAEAARRARAELEARQARARAERAGRSGIVEPPPGTDAPPPSPGAAAAVAFAKRQVGKPYEWGAAGPDSYDCSGLTMASWRQGGVSLPHSSRAQWSATTRVAIGDIQPGDLLFYGRPIHHVGIYVGGGQMIAAPETGRNVQYQSIWRSDLVGAGRPG